MKKEIVKQLKKYSPVPLPNLIYRNIEKINSRTNQTFFYDMNILLLLAKINYFVPKILDYFDFKIYEDRIIFYNDKVELSVNINDIIDIEKTRNFASFLKEYSGRKIHDFSIWFLYFFMKVYYNALKD